MEQSHGQSTQQPPTVLIVDDNPNICALVSWSLHSGGFSPIEAHNGLEAVKWMEHAACGQRFPAIVLLDLGMPGMDGQSFLAWLYSSWVSRYPLPSVIIMTAGSFSETPVDFPPCVKQVIAKPFHVRDLIEVVRTWSA